MKEEKEKIAKVRALIACDIEILRQAGIPAARTIEEVRINARAKKRLGCCRREKNALGRTRYSIELADIVFACSDEDVNRIIVHELIHTCPGCFDHGKKWKYYAARAGKLLGCEIRRTIDPAELGLEDVCAGKGEGPGAGKKAPQIRYRLVCPGCGQVFERKRLCPLIKTPAKYRCGRCGASLAGARATTISCR